MEVAMRQYGKGRIRFSLRCPETVFACCFSNESAVAGEVTGYNRTLSKVTS